MAQERIWDQVSRIGSLDVVVDCAFFVGWGERYVRDAHVKIDNRPHSRRVRRVSSKREVRGGREFRRRVRRLGCKMVW